MCRAWPKRSARSARRSILHKDDLFIYQNAVRTGMMFGLTVEEPPPVDRYYEGDAA